MQIEQNAEIPKYKHDKIQMFHNTNRTEYKAKIQTKQNTNMTKCKMYKIQTRQNTTEQNTNCQNTNGTKYKEQKLQKY